MLGGSSLWSSRQWRLAGWWSQVCLIPHTRHELYVNSAPLSAIIFVVFPPLNFVSSLVVAACLTPTDPIISAAIVGM